MLVGQLSLQAVTKVGHSMVFGRFFHFFSHWSARFCSSTAWTCMSEMAVRNCDDRFFGFMLVQCVFTSMIFCSWSHYRLIVGAHNVFFAGFCF